MFRTLLGIERRTVLPPDPLMSFHKLSGYVVGFSWADKSAMAAINRALQACRRRSRYPGYFIKVHNGMGDRTKCFYEHSIERTYLRS